MGQEAKCKARHDDRVSQGTALLETDYVLFRGDFRVKIPFRAMTSVEAKGPWLEIQSSEGALGLNLGPAADKWAQKILHPPSRLDKLGVKTGMRISIVGMKDPQFTGEVEQRGAELRARVSTDSDIIFFGVEKRQGLNRLAALESSIRPDGAIWVIYPKGISEITEGDVLSAIRAAGLKDVKVASFSATHTALKAVIPVARRAFIYFFSFRAKKSSAARMAFTQCSSSRKSWTSSGKINSSNSVPCARRASTSVTVWLNCTLRSSSPWISNTGECQSFTLAMGDDSYASLTCSRCFSGSRFGFATLPPRALQSCTPWRSTPAANRSLDRERAIAVR